MQECWTIRRLVVGDMMSAKAGDNGGLARMQNGHMKNHARVEQLRWGQHTRSCVGVCTKAATASAKGVVGLVVLAEAAAAESERHIGGRRRCDLGFVED